MKTFIVACISAVILAVIGYAVLSSIQVPVATAYSTSAVRLGSQQL